MRNMQNWTFKIVGLAIVIWTIGCKSNANNSNKSEVSSDTSAVVYIESPVEKVELTGQDLLDTFAEEYYLHYPDNVNFNDQIKVADSINPRKYYKNGDFENALKYYKVQLKQYTDVPYVNFYTAMSAYNTGEYDLAIQHYIIQQEKFPDDKYARVTYFYEGLCYLRKGEVERCQAQMDEYLDRGGIMTGRVSLLNQDIRLKWKKPESQP